MSKIIAFSENRLSPQISLGATGGPEFSTAVTTTANGSEQRNINWFYAKARYNIATGIKESWHLEEVVEFFRVHKGRAIGFRMKDWNDYKATFEEIGKGDTESKKFQLIKTYKKGPCQDVRIIKKPVEGSVQIFVNGKEAAFDCDFKTGLVELAKIPLEGEVVAASFEFDVPVRFDIDSLNLSTESASTLGLDPIFLVEIKL
jgi:uncharacterized protein (TIGR02217 family)